MSHVKFEWPRCNTRRDTDEKLFRPQRLSALRYWGISNNVAWVVEHDESHVSPRWNTRRDMEEKLLLVQEKLPFVRARFGPNERRLWGMVRQCHVSCLCHPAAVQGEVETENCSAWRVKCPSLLLDFGQTCVGCGAWSRSVTCHDRVTPAPIQGEIETKNCFALNTKMPIITAQIRRNLRRMLWERPKSYLSDLATIQGEIRTKNCISLKSKVPFVTAQFRRNLRWVWSMKTGCHVSFLSHPSTIQGVIGARKCFSLKSKVPFSTIRYRPNMPGLGSMLPEFHVSRLSHHASIKGEIRTKNCFGLTTKVLFTTGRLRPDLH
jgi:hypothetical protein